MYTLNFNTTTGYVQVRVFYTYNYYQTSIANSSPITPVQLSGGNLTFSAFFPTGNFYSLFPTDEYLFIYLNNYDSSPSLLIYTINKPNAVFSDVTVNGNLSVQNNVAYKFGSSTWNVPSDGRLKNIIGPVQPNLALERISHIPLYEWEWKCEIANKIKDYKTHKGVMAQDMQLHYPGYVHEVSSSVFGSNIGIPNILTIESGDLIYELIASVQALKSDVDYIKSKIN